MNMYIVTKKRVSYVQMYIAPRVHYRRKRVSNMSMLCLECVQIVTLLECQLFDDHFQMRYCTQAPTSKYMYTVIIGRHS